MLLLGIHTYPLRVDCPARWCSTMKSNFLRASWHKPCSDADKVLLTASPTAGGLTRRGGLWMSAVVHQSCSSKMVQHNQNREFGRASWHKPWAFAKRVSAATILCHHTPAVSGAFCHVTHITHHTVHPTGIEDIHMPLTVHADRQLKGVLTGMHPT
jgi:hypothetical protein